MPPLYWSLIALAAVVFEVTTGTGWGLTVLFGTVAGAVVSYFDGSLEWQLGAAIVVTIISSFIFPRWLRAKKTVPFPHEQTGQVYTIESRLGLENRPRLGIVIAGDFFPITSSASELKEGDKVEFLGMKGILAEVKPLEAAQDA